MDCLLLGSIIRKLVSVASIPAYTLRGCPQQSLAASGQIVYYREVRDPPVAWGLSRHRRVRLGSDGVPMTSDDSPATPLSDEIIGGRFRIRDRLDATGRAEVYVAEHVLTHKRAALKVAHTSADIGDQNLARFQRVARVATQLAHPNCVRISDFGTDDGGYVYLAMELATGRDLSRTLAEDGPLTPAEVVAIASQAADGLAEAHGRGILHTELAPHYVMVDLSSGTPMVKLLGFGLGQVMNGLESGVAVGARLSGRPADYAAPELLSPGLPVDHRADQFALAAVLFEALTGELPWEVERGEPLGRVDQAPRRASRLREDAEITMALDRALARALDPDPNRRYMDVKELADALHKALHGDPRDLSTVATVHRQFGRYRLLRTIARGGMGELHLASSETLPGLTKVCALKRLRPELVEEKTYVERFLAEARLAAQLSHANLATVYDVGKADDSFYIAMELVIGKDCRRIIDRARQDGIQVPVEVALLIARDLADALGYAHRVMLPSGDVGLIHRDVSPTNVLVSYEGQVKLIDFGLAKHATAEGKTETGVVIGKVAYMAPEQCLAEPMDHRADIYSVGAVLFELLTGRKLREGEDFEKVASKLRLPPEVLPGALRDDLPPEVDRVLARTLAPDPDARYSHAEGLRDDLSRILAAIAPAASRDVVAAFLAQIFSAERQSETELAQGLLTRAAPRRPGSALDGPVRAGARARVGDGVGDGVGAGERPPQDLEPERLGGDRTGGLSGAQSSLAVSSTVAMAVVDPDHVERIRKGPPPVPDAGSSGPRGEPPLARGTEAGAGSAALDAEGSQERDVGRLDTLDGLSEVKPSAGSSEGRPSAAGAGRSGASWTLAVLLLLLGLAGGFAVRHLALPDLGRSGSQGRASRAAPRPSMAVAVAADATTPPMRAVSALPRPRPCPVKRTGPSPQEIARLAEARSLRHLEGLARAALLAIGVRVDELPVLPRLRDAYSAVAAATRKGDIARAMDALLALRAELAKRRNRCKKVRRRKYRWARKAVRAIRRAAPRGRKERRGFLELHRWKDLRDQVRVLKKRSRDRKLTCVEKSLAYARLIPQLRQTLAKVSPRKKEK